MRPRLALVSLVFLAIPLAPAVARAEGDGASAQVFFERGRDAAARGDQAAACQAFEESLRLEVAVGTLFNLARCEEALGRLASASQHLHEGLDKLDANDARRGPAAAQAAALDPRVPRLAVRIASAPSTAKAFRDGVELSAVSLGTPLPVNPGRHVVVVRAPGHEPASTEVTLAEGETRSLQIVPGPLSVVPTSATAAPAPTLVTPRWIALGTAGVALGAGLVTGGFALDRSSVVDAHCKEEVCDPEGRAALDEGKRFGTVSTVAFVAAGVLGAAALVLWIAGRPPSTTAGLSPAVRF